MKNQNKKIKRIGSLKWLLYLISVVIITGLLIKLIAEPFFINKIRQTLNNPQSAYSISVENIEIRWMLPGIILNRIIITNRHDSGNIKINGTIEKIRLDRINIFNAVFSGDFKTKKIEVNTGNFNIAYKSIKNPEPFTSKILVDIGQINFNDLTANIHNEDDSLKYFINNLNAHFGRFEISRGDTFGSELLRISALSSMRAGIIQPDSLNTLTAYGVKFTQGTGILGMDSLTFIPKYRGYEYTDRFDYETDRIEVHLANIRLHNISLADLLSNGDFISSYISIDDLNVAALRDKRKSFRHIPRKMMQDMIYDFPGILHIDSIHVGNGKVIYTEHGEKSLEPGTIFFDRIRLSVQNISNHPKYRKEEGWLVLNGSAHLMGKSGSVIKMKARLFDQKNRMELRGKLGEIELNSLNTIFEKNESVSLSGIAHSLEFEITADSEKATGTLSFLYDKLKVDIKNKNGFIRDKISTWLINYSLEDSNPIPDEKPRSGEISYIRDPERFLFNYTVKALMTGIKSTLTKEN